MKFNIFQQLLRLRKVSNISSLVALIYLIKYYLWALSERRSSITVSRVPKGFFRWRHKLK